MAMADRRSLLARLMVALEHPDVDGVLGTPDIVEELLLLGALEGKVVIGSMNRGGLDGASGRWTTGSPGTTPRASPITALRAARCCSASTTRTRQPPAPSNVAPLRLVNLPHRGLLAMVEPLPYHREDDGTLTLLKDARSLARAVTVASGLGTTSTHTWLKMPSCEDPKTVFAATTLPCVVLGGVPGPDAAKDLESWGQALTQPTVRGLVVGRSLLYPPDGNVGAAVAAAAIVLREAAAPRSGA